MGFSQMFSAQNSPIAIDFGSSAVKLIQATPDEPQAAPPALARWGPSSPGLRRCEAKQKRTRCLA